MEHLTYEKIREYIDINEYTQENAALLEEVGEHLMQCDQCAAVYRRMLYACQIVEDFSIQEYVGYLSLEQSLLERYQIEKLLVQSASKTIESRLQDFIKNKLKGIDNSIKVFLCDERHNRVSGLLKNTVDRLSSLNSMQPLTFAAARGAENDKVQDGISNQGNKADQLTNILVSTENKDAQIILNGNTMQLRLQLEYKPSYLEKPPLGILISKEKNIEPRAQEAKQEEELYVITFADIKPGEYTFYLDE